jgi:hypothetical protein
MRRPVLKGVIATLAVALVVGTVAYVHGRPIRVDPRDVVSVRLVPVPEGPTPAPFERNPRDSHSLDISLIEDQIPNPLPHPAWQFGCSIGGILEVELADGRVVSYGPCRRPSSIDHLWAVIVDIVSKGACRPNCGPGDE